MIAIGNISGALAKAQAESQTKSFPLLAGVIHVFLADRIAVATTAWCPNAKARTLKSIPDAFRLIFDFMLSCANSVAS